ncbi:hypothetical protein M413DRAFT_17932 [Hebeloma cylindrosporum]|uniref:Uncharacterized protein n=1 Tax=Hebeloma cylindrosporum TaxID=76867 RepID=A0A0C3C5M7_HEBCY|nr:hypothetical protein M413DRAFT_17932 [Hebeloma cylindrosporum h7]
MASDSSDSPMVLTPESTGTPSSDSPTKSVPTPVKKARRQTAFYPNMNSTNKPQKPFSRSAAKRESVMALGSIEHLQHYFTKTGLAAKKNPLDKPHHGLVPAIGGLLHIPTSPPLADVMEFEMPPSPAVPTISRPPFSPHVKTYEVDPESLLPGVIEDVTAVAYAWKLNTSSESDLDVPFDVLEVLKTTTRAVRSTRNYLLSLPDESATTIRANYTPRPLVRGRPSSSTHNNASGSASPPIADPLVLIRRSALELLTVLRQLEENCRLPLSDETYDAQSDGGHSRGAGTSSSPSNAALDLPVEPDVDPDASITFSLVQVQGRYETVPVWEDEEDVFDEEEQKEKRERWEDRLVLGSGWLYKQDVKLSQLGKERTAVGSYLDIVDEVLFEGKQGPESERGWDRVRRKIEGKASSRAKNRRVSMGDTEGRTPGLLEPGDRGRRRVSTGMLSLMQNMSLSEEPEDMDDIREELEEEWIDDEDLPGWAKRSNFVDDRLGRVHALLSYFLPPDLQPALASPSADSRTAFLSSLSSGQLLCFGYNACVRKSKKPWGFVSKDGIHDIIALELAAKQEGEDDKGKKLWTFRRTDNLRLWAGALKLRYMMPIQVPSQPVSQTPPPTLTPSSSAVNTPLSSPSSSFQRFPLGKADREPPILFDARIVAKKDEGWEDMLEAVLFRWVDKVVDERRVFH